MKNKICGILTVMLLVGTLYGCAEAELTEQKAKPLVINTEQYIESKVTVYAEGTDTFEYQGKVKVTKWSFDGIPREIEIRVGDTDD